MIPTAPPIIQAAALSLAYGKTPIIHGLNLTLAHGEILGITGPNGTGKTTILKAIAGIHPIGGGTLHRHPAAANPGYVPQQPPIAKNFPLTVTEYLALNAPSRTPWLRGIPKKILHGICGKLDCLHISHLARRPLGTLSGGELQRVRIAAALLGDPTLLLLDEPSNHLDAPATAALKDLLFHLHRQHHLTLILVTHDPHFLQNLATRTLTLPTPKKSAA